MAVKGLKTTTLTDTPRRVEHEHDVDPTMDSLQLLLREAGRYPLLKPVEEIELAKRTITAVLGELAGEAP